jgi:hypothetical protein
MAENLTTLYLFKVHAGISLTDTTNDTKIINMINQVSAGIASYCNRTFENQEYKKWMDGSGAYRMTLPDWPITNLKGVSMQTDKVADISYTGGIQASVFVSGTTMTLNAIDATGAASATDITLSGLTSDVAALVNAETGWTMTVVSGQESRPMILANVLDGGDALNLNSVEMSVPSDFIESRVVADSNQMIEIPSLNYGFDRVTYQGRPGGYYAGASNVFVWYEAGYTLPAPVDSNATPTTPGNVPEDLVLICNEITKEIYDGSKSDATMKSEKFTNYSYTKAGTVAGAAIKDAVSRYSDALVTHVSGRLY